MPFRVIRGTFHIAGYSPDGDSLRFAALNNSNWSLLSGGPIQLNGRGHAQLRLEAIDTLETHYLGMHQPPDLARKALDFLLHSVGITGVQWDVLMSRVTEANDGTPGYIISRAIEKFGRPVAFVFSGDPPENDGASIFFDEVRLEQSVNYKSVAEGLAYATYYKGFFSDLRLKMTAAVLEARAQNLNVWAEDRTTGGFDVPDLFAITDRHVIMPKLFRRLVEYLDGGGHVAGFKEFLEAKNEGVTIIAGLHFTHFDNLVDVDGNVVRMLHKPEGLIFEG